MIKREIQALKDLGQDHLVSFRRSDVLAHHDRAGGIFVHLDMFQPTAIQCTEVRFDNFLSSGFTTMAVINPPEKKLAKRTSVQCASPLLHCHYTGFASPLVMENNNI